MTTDTRTLIPLPAPTNRGLEFETALARRRSLREYAATPLTLAQLAQLAYAALGMTDRERGLRAAPSAGALYPFDLYLVINRVNGIASGIYRYLPDDHALALVQPGAFGDRLAVAALGQETLKTAGVVFAMVAVPAQITRKYGDRGRRYIDMEAGHISQNLYLQATSLGLGSVAIGAFRDDAVNRLVGVDGTRATVVYLHPVGVPQ